MSTIKIEVAFALPDRQWLKSLTVTASKTAREIISESGLRASVPDFDFDNCLVGIWGREIEWSTLLRDGDRLEVYRPLELDPREARRRLALLGKTMSSANTAESSD